MSVAANKLGTAFVTALAQKDWSAIGNVLADDVDFRALTPGRAWEITGAANVVTDVLTVWFDENDEIEDVLSLHVRPVTGARSQLSYRLRVRNPGGSYLVEQVAYFDCTAEKITYVRLICSGFLPT